MLPDGPAAFPTYGTANIQEDVLIELLRFNKVYFYAITNGTCSFSARLIYSLFT